MEGLTAAIMYVPWMVMLMWVAMVDCASSSITIEAPSLVLMEHRSALTKCSKNKKDGTIT